MCIGKAADAMAKAEHKMYVDYVLNGLATKIADACTANGICSGGLLIDKITNKKERFKDNEVNTYDKNYKQQ